jgi:starch synthase
VISRLADQKGFDILTGIFKQFMSLDLFFVLLGTGDIEYHEMFEKLKTRYNNKTGITIAFDNELAHQIEAGADMFLMPSRYEPCGLNQMISLKYGTVPVVRATGGLDDTIQDFGDDPARGNGFKFEEYSGKALLEKIEEAVSVYQDKETWQMLQKRGMLQDFSWNFAASQYVRIYDQLLD